MKSYFEYLQEFVSKDSDEYWHNIADIHDDFADEVKNVVNSMVANVIRTELDESAKQSIIAFRDKQNGLHVGRDKYFRLLNGIIGTDDYMPNYYDRNEIFSYLLCADSNIGDAVKQATLCSIGDNDGTYSNSAVIDDPYYHTACHENIYHNLKYPFHCFECEFVSGYGKKINICADCCRHYCLHHFYKSLKICHLCNDVRKLNFYMKIVGQRGNFGNLDIGVVEHICRYIIDSP